MADPHSILKKVFGYDSFRPGLRISSVFCWFCGGRSVRTAPRKNKRSRRIWAVCGSWMKTALPKCSTTS